MRNEKYFRLLVPRPCANYPSLRHVLWPLPISRHCRTPCDDLTLLYPAAHFFLPNSHRSSWRSQADNPYIKRQGVRIPYAAPQVVNLPSAVLAWDPTGGNDGIFSTFGLGESLISTTLVTRGELRVVTGTITRPDGCRVEGWRVGAMAFAGLGGKRIMVTIKGICKAGFILRCVCRVPPKCWSWFLVSATGLGAVAPADVNGKWWKISSGLD